jgi:CspA family cold shock protein
MKGNVKWFNKERGFGFIISEDNRNVFIHYSRIITKNYQELEMDEEVIFDIANGEHGFEALNVRRINESL